MYLSDHSKNLISAEEKVAELIKQRDQLRAEVERLKFYIATTIQPDEYAKVIKDLRAEVERLKTCGIVEIAASNPSVLDYCKHWEARAQRAEAELTAERARLDWLEDNSVCYHVCIDRQPDGYSIHNSPPSPGSVRAAIDAAMKEGVK